MKEYFSHDYFSRNDPKILKLRMVEGWQGVGLFWALVEIAYEQGGFIKSENIETIAFDLRTECERITNVLQSYGLFYFQDEAYFSESIDRRLSERTIKSEKARKSANSRWEKPVNQNVNANAMRTHSEGNAIKEKESKEKNKKEDIKNDDFNIFWGHYHRTTGLPKTDLEAAKKKWANLNQKERKLAFSQIEAYAKTNEPKYLKKARTYLADKTFNDEMKPRQEIGQPIKQTRLSI